MKNKVYCEDCKFNPVGFSGCLDWIVITGTEKNPIYEAVDANANNDCQEFEPKPTADKLGKYEKN